MSAENSEILRIYEQVVNMQHAQGRLIDQQTTLLENQDVSISELITEVENLVNAVRGSVDGTVPSIRESIRTIERHLEQVETQTTAGINETRQGLEHLRGMVKQMEKDAAAHDLRIQSLEKGADDARRRSNTNRGMIASFIVSVLLLILGATLTKACDAWVTLN